jgi:hypothetical protein
MGKSISLCINGTADKRLAMAIAASRFVPALTENALLGDPRV